MTTLSHYMDTDCITVRKQINANLQFQQTLVNRAVVHLWNPCNMCNIYTETQLTSGSSFIPGNVIVAGASTTSSSENSSVFILMVWDTSCEDAVYISPHRPRTFSKSVTSCKTNNDVTITAMHSHYIKENPGRNNRPHYFDMTWTA
jgi:hypothetical protein